MPLQPADLSRFQDLCLHCSLEPLADRHEYEKATRLLQLLTQSDDGERTEAEELYFQALAIFTTSYEREHFATVRADTRACHEADEGV